MTDDHELLRNVNYKIALLNSSWAYKFLDIIEQMFPDQYKLASKEFEKTEFYKNHDYDERVLCDQRQKLKDIIHQKNRRENSK